jgi:hypothetical protein
MTSNYDFLPPSDQLDIKPDSGDANGLLIAAGQRLGVLSLATGKQHPILQAKAQEHAQYQADHQEQGHQLWDQRYHELYQLVPECQEFKEVCAESWPENTEAEAAEEMYNSWRHSPGHWSAVNGRCDFWGYAMVRGSNGIWYATGQFGLLQQEAS